MGVMDWSRENVWMNQSTQAMRLATALASWIFFFGWNLLCMGVRCPYYTLLLHEFGDGVSGCSASWIICITNADHANVSNCGEDGWVDSDILTVQCLCCQRVILWFQISTFDKISIPTITHFPSNRDSTLSFPFISLLRTHFGRQDVQDGFRIATSSTKQERKLLESTIGLWPVTDALA